MPLKPYEKIEKSNNLYVIDTTVVAALHWVNFCFGYRWTAYSWTHFHSPLVLFSTNVSGRQIRTSSIEPQCREFLILFTIKIQN